MIEAFIIRLKGHELSERLSRECINQAKIFNADVKTFDAIWGKDYEYHLQHLNLKLMEKRKKTMSLGHFGNFFSHYYLWLHCLEIQQPLLILEHDGYMIRQLPENICDHFTDILKLDRFSPYNSNYVDKINQSLNMPVKIENSIKDIHKKKKNGWYTTGSYGYVIKPQGAKKLKKFIKRNGFTSTDNLLADGILDVSITSSSVVRLHPLFEEGIHKYSTIPEMEMPNNE